MEQLPGKTRVVNFCSLGGTLGEVARLMTAVAEGGLTVAFDIDIHQQPGARLASFSTAAGTINYPHHYHHHQHHHQRQRMLRKQLHC